MLVMFVLSQSAGSLNIKFTLRINWVKKTKTEDVARCRRQWLLYHEWPLEGTRQLLNYTPYVFLMLKMLYYYHHQVTYIKSVVRALRDPVCYHISLSAFYLRQWHVKIHIRNKKFKIWTNFASSWMYQWEAIFSTGIQKVQML